MPQTLEFVDEAEDIKRRKAEAKEHFTAIKEAGIAVSRSSMTIGYHAYRLKVEGLFGVLGFADEHEARKAAGVGESTWFANIRLAEQFKELPEKRFVAMKQANAKALADLPESQRLSTEWVRMAETMKIEEFAAKIDEAMNGKARASDTQERSTTMKISMPASSQQVIEEKVKVYAEAHGLDGGDIGNVLVAMCVETTEGDTLSGAFADVVQLIKKAKEIIRGGLSADEALGKVDNLMDEMVERMDAAAKLAIKEPAAA